MEELIVPDLKPVGDWLRARPLRAHSRSASESGIDAGQFEPTWKLILEIGEQVKRKFRLRKSTDFKRVRRMGKSYAHPLIVLVTHPNDDENSRFAITAGRTLGKAVDRNRAKRLIREALRPLLPSTKPGWDILVIARRPMASTTLQQSQAALAILFQRAGLLKENDGN